LDAAIRFSDQVQPLDVLILGRGGGSAEDLAAFSDERVIRAVFGCQIPIISAVGHEIDFAISDFVADLRAPTPASAAELVAPDCREVSETVCARVAWMTRIVAAHLTNRSDRLRANLRGYLFRLPGRKLETLSQRLDGLVDILARRVSQMFTLRVRRLAHFTDVLRLSDPRLPLHRGYSLTFLKDSAVALRDVARVTPGSEIVTQLATGRLQSRVEEVMDE